MRCSPIFPTRAEPVGEKDRRIDLAIELINGLNEKYGSLPYGGFYFFHRHRIFNPREGAWMGWERKRGKLLDLNQYLRDSFDPFPVKAGDFDRSPSSRKHPLCDYARFRYPASARLGAAADRRRWRIRLNRPHR